MLRDSFDLGSLFGIRIKLNWSVLVIFGLIVVNLAVGVFPSWHPQWSPALNWTVALAAAVVFFLSLLAHELAHSLTAQSYGIPVRSITLFLFGGVSDIQEEPHTPGRELIIAIVGPLMSLALGIVFLWVFKLITPLATEDVEQQVQLFARLGPVASVLAWVGPINILLAIFNMIPALPLDGGRVFRALLWKVTGDLKKATRWASTVARVISWAFIAAGVAMIFGISVPFLGTGVVGGIWLAVIGWFLGRSASAAYTMLLVDETLEGIQVSRLVHEHAPFVSPTVSVDELIDHYFMGSQRVSFPVVDNGRFVGMVRFSDVHKLDQDDWPTTPVADLTVPPDEIVTVELHEDVSSALKNMLRHSVDQAPVLYEGQYRGMLFEHDIFKWIKMHSNLSVPGTGVGAS